MWCLHADPVQAGASEQSTLMRAGAAAVANGAAHRPSGVGAASSGTSCALSQVADPRPLCQSAIVSGTLLHADRFDSATGCMSRTCKGVVTERSAEVS